MATGVLAWWLSLCLVSVVNVFLWLQARRLLARGALGMDPRLLRSRRIQLWLSAVYVGVCAFRSWLPRADVQRICLVDSWLSSVAVGRSLATVAELCFAVQWALLLYEVASSARSRFGVTVSRMLPLLIVFAEVASWYATVTTNFLGNAVEQSTWALSGLLTAWGFAAAYGKSTLAARRVIRAAALVLVPFVFFMVSIDVPLYFSRWSADQAAGMRYLGGLEGLRDSAFRWVVTGEWEPWRDEMTWMALYFSIGVWTSIAMSLAPSARPGSPPSLLDDLMAPQNSGT